MTSSTKTKDRPFECVACGQSFATKEELEAHISALILSDKTQQQQLLLVRLKQEHSAPRGMREKTFKIQTQ